MTKKRKSKWGKWFGGVLAILFVAAAVIFYLLESSPKFHSSPTESRDTPGYLKNTHYIDRTPVPTFELHRFELVGIAVWVPAPEDPTPDQMPFPNWRFPLNFRNPETDEFIDEADLKSQGVPAEWFDLEPVFLRGYRAGLLADRPFLRLLIRSRDESPIDYQFRATAAFDTRTGAAAATSFPRSEHFAVIKNEWAILDFQMRIWHDTTLEIALPEADLTEVQKFRIDELPELPNPREIENLFEARMPRVSVHPQVQSSRIHLSEERFLEVIAHATETAMKVEALLWLELDEHRPAAFPADFTFRNTTPQQLLDWYLENTPGSSFRYDAKEKLMIFNGPKEETWWDRTKSWWHENKPGWL